MRTVKEYNDMFDIFVKSDSNGYIPWWNSRFHYFDENFIQWYWIIDGTGGGSCWEDERTGIHFEGNPEPDFTPLDDFITNYFPNIVSIKYKRLLSKINYTSHYENEYYGNSITYGIKYIEKQELLKALQDIGEVEK